MTAPPSCRRPRRPLDPVESVLLTSAWVGAGVVLSGSVLAARCDVNGLYAAVAVLLGSCWWALHESERRSDCDALQAEWIAYRLRRRGPRP